MGVAVKCGLTGMGRAVSGACSMRIQTISVALINQQTKVSTHQLHAQVYLIYHRLKKSGRKDELITRILEHMGLSVE